MAVQRQVAKEFAMGQVRRAQRAEEALKDTAEWLQRSGFPFTWQTEETPPSPLYRALARAWADHRSRRGYDWFSMHEAYKGAIADAAGWPRLKRESRPR